MSEQFNTEYVGIKIDHEDGLTRTAVDVFINNMENFAKEAAKKLDELILRCLGVYGITKENIEEYVGRIDVLYLNDVNETKRRYYLDKQYLFTIRSWVDSDFEDLHAEFCMEVTCEELKK